MNSLTIRIMPALLIAATSCTNDRSLPSEPVQEVAYESAVVESNGGYVPDSTIVMYQGETESTLFTFTTGIGECDPTCAYIDGSPWGVSFGYPDGDDYPNGNQTWRIMSAGYAKSDQAPRQSFIEFDPPVRSVTFIYDAGACGGFNGGSGCVDDFWVGALDISFLTIHSDTVYDKIRLRVLDLDGELTIAADPGHIVVQGNYSATYDVLRSNGQFKPEVLEDVYP